MKIGFDAKRLYNNLTGLGNHSRTTIDILTEYFPEDKCILYTPKMKNAGIAGIYLDKPNCQTVTPKGLLRGSLWRTFAVAGDAKKHGVDVFHGLSNELPVGLRNAGIPSVVTIHDVAFRTFKDMYHWQDRQIYDMKWRYACKNATKIIAISECTKRDIIRFYDIAPDKIDVVYQPVCRRYYDAVNEEEIEQRIKSASFIPESGEFMLYVGSVNLRKNLLGVVKAIELLPKDLQLPLIVVGDGREYKKEVMSYISAHGIEDKIIFPKERVTDDVLQALYNRARLFVYPSFYEGFGLPVVEALLSHCPVVTSNVSSLPEAGGPYSLLADPHDVADIADKMEKALSDSELYEQMKQKGYEYVIEHYHPEVLAHRLMDVYNEILLP